MSGPADGDEGPAAAGPPGLLQEESRDWDGILQKPGETGRTLHGKDSQHQGSPAVQVRRHCLSVRLCSVLFMLSSGFIYGPEKNTLCESERGISFLVFWSNLILKKVVLLWQPDGSHTSWWVISIFISYSIQFNSFYFCFCHLFQSFSNFFAIVCPF